MEGGFRPETLPLSVDTGCFDELIRSNSDASTLTAENCEDILHRSVNVKDEHTTWTEEKHSLYLEHLEVTFVKQLHQSMRLLGQCSELNKGDENISQMRPTNVHNASEKFTVVRYGRGEKINCERENHRKVIMSHGLQTSRKDSASGQYHGDLYNLMREGTGQNFVDEDDQNQSNTKSRVKRLKPISVDYPQIAIK